MADTVLVTGSSRGIGKACALYLAKNGYDIVLHCSNDISRLDLLKSEIRKMGVNCRTLAFDVKNRAECAEKIRSDVEKNGMYYGIVINAGIAKDNPFPIMEDFEWDEVLDTNLGGFYNVIKPIIMDLIQEKRGFRIVTGKQIGRAHV